MIVLTISGQTSFLLGTRTSLESWALSSFHLGFPRQNLNYWKACFWKQSEYSIQNNHWKVRSSIFVVWIVLAALLFTFLSLGSSLHSLLYSIIFRLSKNFQLKKLCFHDFFVALDSLLCLICEVLRGASWESLLCYSRWASHSIALSQPPGEHSIDHYQQWRSFII